MPKFIITITGKPNIHGHKRGEFIWVEERKKFLFLGRVIEAAEFNKLSAIALDRYPEYHPKCELLPEEAAAPVEPVAPVVPLVPVSTIAPVTEITLEMALDVVERQAPALLKKNPGKKPAASAA